MSRQGNPCAPVRFGHLPRWCGVAALLPLAAWSGSFDCVVEPRQVVEVRTSAPGLIRDVRVRRGDLVKAGQLVVEIDATVDRASLALAAYRAQMVAAERTAQARLAFANAKAARMKNLAGENFVSAQDRDSALAEQQLAEAQLVEAQENRRLAVLEHQRQDEQVRQRSLRSPIDGVVVDRGMHPGELASSDDTAKPILKLADLSVLHVEVLLPIAAWNKVKVGQPVEVAADVPGTSRRTGKVLVVDRLMDAASATFGVRLEMRNPQLDWPAGVRCKAEFPDVSVPARSLPAR